MTTVQTQQQTQAKVPAGKPVIGCQARYHDRQPTKAIFSVGFNGSHAAVRAQFKAIMGRDLHDHDDFREQSQLQAAETEDRRALQMVEFGRQEVREGVKDAGVSVFSDGFPMGLTDADLESVVMRLIGRGYLLAEIYAYENAQGKPFLRFVFTKTAKRGLFLESQRAQAIDYLAQTFRFLHVWDNRDTTGTITYNMPHPLKELKAAHTVSFKSDTSWGHVATPVTNQ